MNDFSISDDVLDKAPKRALNLLSGISRNPQIREILAGYGYTDAVHQQGWALLGATGGNARPAPQAPAPAATGNVVDAVTQLGAWNVRVFAIANASLRHTFPAQHAYVFQGDLKAQQGNGAVVSASTFLQRLDALATDPARGATRDEDCAALARLEERSVTRDERAHASELIARIQDGAPVVPPPVTPKAAVDHRAAKVALYQWFDEWSSIAHAAITRRDLLIRIGLASPKPRKDAKAAAKPATPPVPPGRPSAAPAPN